MFGVVVSLLLSRGGYVRGLSVGRVAQPVEEVSGRGSGLVKVCVCLC